MSEPSGACLYAKQGGSFLYERSEKAPAAEQIAGYDDYRKERPAYQREGLDEASALSGVFPDIDAVVYHARERAYQRDQARSIGAVYQPCEVLGERIENNRCRHIRDELAQPYRPPVLIPCHCFSKEPRYAFVRSDRRREYEKAQEREQQNIIDFAKQPSVNCRYHHEDDNEHYIPITGPCDYNAYDEQKQKPIGYPFYPAFWEPFRRGRGNVCFDSFAQVFAIEHQNKDHEQHPRHNVQRQHMQYEILSAGSRLAIQKQILRAPERRQQRTPDCGDVFHRYHRKNILLLIGCTKDHDRKRNKDDERDVVRDEH